MDIDYKPLYLLYLNAYGLKKVGDSETASNLVSHATGQGVRQQYAVALGLRDAADDEYTVEDDDDTCSAGMYHYAGFVAAMKLAFEGFDA